MKLFRAGSCVCTGQDWLQILERLAAFVALWNLIGVVIVRQVGGLLEGDIGLDNGLASWLAHVVVVVVVVSDDGGVLDLS